MVEHGTAVRVRQVLSICLASVLAFVPALAQTDDRIQLRFDTSEAEAVLMLLAKRQAGQPVLEGDWQRLFASEPYRRLKEREAGMRRTFSDEAFQRFVLSDSLLLRAAALRTTLEQWTSRDLQASAQRVLAYLPPAARIRAKVYPVIKPQPNTFVFDVTGDPAIFFSIDPAQSPAQFENIVAHELHHIGFASVPRPGDSTASPGVRAAVGWMSAFGEGFAMLAAVGGPDTHPHAASPPEERARWDRDMANFNDDLRKLESFFLDLMDGRLTAPDSIRQRGLSFFGVQGPWYTVGYRMAVTVERRAGRAAVIAAMADPRQLLTRYNAAAAEANAAGGVPLALWSERLLQLAGAR